MKKLSIFSIVLALAVLFTSCAKDTPLTSLAEIEVSQTYLPIALSGGSCTVTIDANMAWEFGEIPKWLTVSDISGAANTTTKVTISAPSSEYGREAVLQIRAGVHTQFLTVRQGDMTAEEVTCKEAMTGTAGKTYRIKGTVTKIVNTTYGNLYLTDGSITDADKLDENAAYVYGTLDEKGAEKNFLSLGIEVGDLITIEGPLSFYGTTPELVNVTVLKIEKSLLKLDNNAFELPKEGGSFEVAAAYKGKGAFVDIPSGSWISLEKMDFIPGVPSKLERNPADTAILKFNVAANDGEARSISFNVFSENADGKTEMAISVAQGGNIRDLSIAEFLSAPVGEAQYRISGIITKVVNADYGNVNVKDYSGEAYVYGIGSKGDFKTLGLKVGDIVTLVGTRGEYNGSAQMAGGQYVSHKSVTTVTAAEAAKLSDDNKKDPQNYILLSGVVTEAGNGNTTDLVNYGNFDLVDASGAIYIYGVSTGWNGQTKKFSTLNVSLGDKITIVGYKTSYNGKPQVVGMFVSKESASEATPYDNTVKYVNGANCDDTGSATINGTEVKSVIKIGTSSKTGDFTVNIPAGAKKLSFYAVAWKGQNDVKVQILDGETVVAEQAVAPNTGATGNPPYTITVTDSDKYSINVPAGKTLKITSDKRVIFFAMKTE